MRDIDIRKAIKESLLQKYYLDTDSRVVEELNVGLGNARVDIAVINGSLHAYEIKSESDNLNRLESQIEAYTTTFDFITVVVGKKHLSSLIEILPFWCGIIVVSKKKSDELKFKKLRSPKRNYSLNKLAITQLLWKEELLDLLNDAGKRKGLNGMSKPLLRQMIIDAYTTKDLASKVRAKLKARVNWRSDQSLFQNDDCCQPFSMS